VRDSTVTPRYGTFVARTMKPRITNDVPSQRRTCEAYGSTALLHPPERESATTARRIGPESEQRDRSRVRCPLSPPRRKPRHQKAAARLLLLREVMAALKRNPPAGGTRYPSWAFGRSTSSLR
jgi:hypothetical protein